MFNTKDLEPQNVHTHPIPIANVHEIESEEQFHTPDSKSTQVHMDNLLCVETLSQSPHDILQSKSSGENAVSFYDRETSSDMHNGMYIYCIHIRSYVHTIATFYS